MNKGNDIFSEIIKNKLENYTLPVDNNAWDEIDICLNSVPRRKNKRRWIVAVAAGIAILFLLYPIHKNYYHETTNPLSNHEETIIQDVPEKEIFQSILHPNVKNLAINKKSKRGTSLAKKDLIAEHEVVTKENIAEAIAPEASSEAQSTASSENQSQTLVNSSDPWKDEPLPRIKRKKQQSIGISLSASSRNIYAKNNGDFLNSGMPSQAPGAFFNISTSYYKAAVWEEGFESRTEEILSYENFSERVLHPPLSFGITLKKELNRRFAIESGLIYSFIATEFSKDLPKTEANLYLHYIGIPLNLHTQIYGDRFSKWGIYLSAGGMVEKGILSHFSQKTDYDNYTDTKTSNEKIKGLQWSVGISPGADYRISKSYSIYFEPKVSYYFDNNQPLSARTEHPVVFGVNAGLRYTW